MSNPHGFSIRIPETGFAPRHLGPSPQDVADMLQVMGLDDLDALLDEAVPEAIRTDRPLDLPPARDEHAVLAELRRLAAANRPRRSFLGQGYHGTRTPAVIVRNLLENPSWYTAYTPYQAEISQGRLEALLVFQTMVAELTGMEVANASLLDEATAAAEAMAMAHRVLRGRRDRFLVSPACHPATLAVLRTRAAPMGIRLEEADPAAWLAEHPDADDVFGALVQVPDTDGLLADPTELAEALHARKALLVVATDLLALTLVREPGAQGADIVVGSTQRFGVPLGYGGPHAAFLATRARHVRQAPGRIIGVSRDAEGRPALRMAIQTREQHIRRERATSNICTAQVLLAVVAAMYAVWHGPDGLRRIALRLRDQAARLQAAARQAGWSVVEGPRFDTVHLLAPAASRRDEAVDRCREAGILVRPAGLHGLVVALDETATDGDIEAIARAMGAEAAPAGVRAEPLPEALRRTSPYLRDPVFREHRTETAMMRYLHRLAARDIALDTSMIPLGSCTMKLNPAVAMAPVTWPEFTELHPHAPPEDAAGTRLLVEELSAWLAEITGFDAISMQPNAGAQGEYTGLLTIRAWHRSRGEPQRDVCLIPSSAHGTNPASAVMAGYRVVTVACDAEGNIDVADLEAKAERHADRLGALMVTYPSTHGVFEASIRHIAEVVHARGGQVYFDGANMNALVGIARPAELGADVCHINLHKTFAIPHGGGGPGMGPIGVRAHLAPFLPGHPVVDCGGEQALGTVAQAPFGSVSILPISWAYIAMLGAEGLRAATATAILNANYVAARLDPYFPVLYRGERGRVAHECILDLRPFKKVGVEAEDVAKRLVDYGFHAPTLSFPVPGTLMVEPTESESKAELDRFCDAMIAIREEIRAVEEGRVPVADSPLKRAPHTLRAVTAEAWDRPYGRQEAAFPAPWTRVHKAWPAVARIDNPWGDRNLVATLGAWAAHPDLPGRDDIPG